MERILIPTDFSKMAQNALDYGVELARLLGGAITVLHAVEKPTVPPQGPVRDRSEIPEEDETSMTRWEELEGISKKIRQGPEEIDKVDQILPKGLPGDEIIKAVREEKSELIVMGAKGEKGFSDSVMGTTAANVLQKAPCNVLMIPENARFKKYERIAYASDLNAKDPQALKELFRFLAGHSAQVDVVHVQGKNEAGELPDQKAFEQELKREGIWEAVNFEQVEGKSLENALDAFIDRREAELLVMLNEDRNFFQRLLHNSKSKKMAFHTKIPLLVLHPHF
ncbi:MAG: universal stress protein [Flavobacteriales bacterium]